MSRGKTKNHKRYHWRKPPTEEDMAWETRIEGYFDAFRRNLANAIVRDLTNTIDKPVQKEGN